MSTRSASTAERFVGRAMELRQLEAACGAAAAGRGTLAVVSGPAGIGRTRFADELARRAEALDLRVVVGRCWPDGGAPRLWPWQPIVARLRGAEVAAALEPPFPPHAAHRGESDGGERFRWLAGLAEEITAACSGRPTCVVVDDIHAADADALLLTRLVGRALAHVPLVLVLTRRSDARDATGDTQRLIDDIVADALPVVLPPLGADDARALLPVDDELAGVVWRLAGGRPRALHRVAALGAPAATDGAVPPGLRLAVDEAVGRLSVAAQRVLRTSAVLGPAPLVATAAEVAGRSPVEVLDAVDEAREVGLAGTEGPDRFAFAHPLVRDALAEGLTGAERLDAHARAAHLTAASGTDPAEWARHALAAAPRSLDDARHAVAACRGAAAAMAGRGQPARADELLTAAVELHDGSPLGPPDAELLVAWARAGLARGRIGEARSRFDRASRAAEATGDPELVADAALGLSGHGVGEQRTLVERTGVLERQQRAHDGLPDGHPLRTRLAARLAAEAVVDGGPPEPLRRALDAVRSGGDPRALGEVLVLCHHAFLTPVHDRERLGWADEIIRAATVLDDDALGLTGLWFRTIDLLHLGEAAALPSLADLRQRAVALDAQHVLAGVALADVLLDIRAGRLDAAEAAAVRAHRQGRAVGEVNAAGYLAAQRLGIAWIRGRDADVVDQAGTVAAAPEVQYAAFAFRAGAAAMTARAGRPARARALLDDLAPDGLAAVPPSSTWLVGMLAVAELAAALDDPDLARTVYDLVEPYAGLPTLGGAAVLCLGSTERTLGIAARTFGDHDRAVGHLERAIGENRRLPHRPMAAIAQADLAAALVARDAPGDRARAAGLLAEAIAAGEEMALDPPAAAWRAELASSTSAAAPGLAEPTATATATAMRHGVIRQVEGRWTVALEGQRVRVGDLVGMRYLSELLTRPGQVIAAVTLASHGSVPRSTTPQEVLDDEARAAYAARAHELTGELAEAEADNDIGRAERLRLEMDALVDELESATGLGGRSRTFNDPVERARTSVRKAIKRAIDVIDDANPAIAEILRSTVGTGTSCVYTPDPRRPVTWSTDEHPPDDEHEPRAGPAAAAETIGDRARSATRRGFVGRRAEIDLVRSALAAVEGPPPFSVLHVHGPGGVGKTALLDVLAAEAEAAGARAVRLDMHTVEPTPAAFLRRLGAGLGWVGADLTPDALAAAGRVVVLVDTVERAMPLARWLRDELIAHLPTNVLVVLAGRQPPDAAWRADPGWRAVARVVALGNLSPDEAQAYLDLHGIAPPWHDRLVALTHGHPLALSLAVDLVRQRTRPGGPEGTPATALDDLADAPELVALLLERFADEIDDPRQRAALAVCAHARFTTEDLLRAALGGDDAGALLAWLRSRSFVEEGRFGLFPHDLARQVLDADLRWRDRVAYEDLHRRMRAHIVQRIRETAGRARHRAAADVLYLHRLSSAMRPMYDWADLGTTDIDRLSPAEHADVRAIAGRHLGPEEATLVDHWLDRQPAAFLGFRRGRRLVGFTALLRLDRASADDVAADPATRAAGAFARRHDPPRPGEAVSVARFAVDAGHGQRRPSPTWEGFSIAHVLHTLETPDLAWDFMAAFADPAYEPTLEYIDYHRVPGADFVVDGDERRVFAHDWRRLEWEAFVDMMGDRELDDGGR